MWILFVLLFYLFVIQLEWAKFRYSPENLKQTIFEKTQIEPLIQQKDFKGKTIQYFQVGQNNTDPVIIFVHGSPGSLSAYEIYLSDTSLIKNATLISIDRLGFGYSDFGNAEGSLAIQADMLASVMFGFKGRKIILAGHSMGGPVIVRAAIDYPDLVDGLLLIAPSISPELEPTNGWRKIVNWTIFQWFTPPALRVSNQEIIPLKNQLEMIYEEWDKIKIPVTVIQGEDDSLVPKGNADFAEIMLVNSPALEIKMVEKGNHFILWSEPQLIKESILELLKKVE